MIRLTFDCKRSRRNKPLVVVVEEKLVAAEAVARRRAWPVNF